MAVLVAGTIETVRVPGLDASLAGAADRRPGLVIARSKFRAATGAGLDGGEEGGPHGPLVEDPERGGRRA